jgi:hypothetical protein
MIRFHSIPIDTYCSFPHNHKGVVGSRPEVWHPTKHPVEFSFLQRFQISKATYIHYLGNITRHFLMGTSMVILPFLFNFMILTLLFSKEATVYTYSLTPLGLVGLNGKKKIKKTARQKDNNAPLVSYFLDVTSSPGVHGLGPLCHGVVPST